MKSSAEHVSVIFRDLHIVFVNWRKSCIGGHDKPPGSSPVTRRVLPAVKTEILKCLLDISFLVYLISWKL